MTLLNAQQAVSFATPQAWQFLVQFFIIAIALIVANIIRRKVRLLSKSLIPTALIAGVLILCLKTIPAFQTSIDKSVMELVTYHALGLGFIALALKNNKIESRSSTMKVAETGALTASTYVIQGIVGLAVTISLFLWWNRDTFFYSSGLLLPMGYGQGPGQALNIGTTYQQAAALQDSSVAGRPIVFHGTDFGLSIAAIGVLIGSLVGVVYMNVLRKKGKLVVKSGDYREAYTLQDYESDNEVPHSESMDKMSIQICLVLLVYAMVFGLMYGVEHLDIGNFGKTLKPLVWGFNFLWGTIFGVLLKYILRRTKEANWMHREYINNYLLNRISGFCFDVMIVAGTAAISFENLRNIWVPLVLVCIVGATATFWHVLRACRHLYPTYSHAAFFSMFGMLTGTASNGMILLREIDPKFETPAANNLVLQTIPAIIFGFPILLLVGLAPQSLQHTLITLAILVAIYIIFWFFIYRAKIFHHSAKTDKK